MLNYETLDEHFLGGLQRYFEHRIPPGHFLTAVLSNDLREACARADIYSREHLFELVSWIYAEAPSPCWGSAEAVDLWLNGERRRNPPVIRMAPIGGKP